MIEDALLGALLEAVKLSPAVLVLLWQAWRADMRAQACLDRLLDHLDKEH